MKFKCPVCNKQVVVDMANNNKSYFPFCSERCKLIDLGCWFDEDYKITTKAGISKDTPKYQM